MAITVVGIVVVVGFVIGVRLEVDLHEDLLEVQVAVEVVFEAEDPLAALVGAENEERPGGPLPVAEEGKPAVLVEPEAPRILAPVIEDPLP